MTQEAQIQALRRWPLCAVVGTGGLPNLETLAPETSSCTPCSSTGDSPLHPGMAASRLCWREGLLAHAPGRTDRDEFCPYEEA